MSNGSPRRIHLAPGAQLVAQGKMRQVRTPKGGSPEMMKAELFFIYTYLIDQVTQGVGFDDFSYNRNPQFDDDETKARRLSGRLFDGLRRRKHRRAVVRAADLLDAITPEDTKKTGFFEKQVRPLSGWARIRYFIESQMHTPPAAAARILSEFNGISLLRMFYEQTAKAVFAKVRSEVPEIGTHELRQIARNSVGLVLTPANGYVSQLFTFIGVGERDRPSGINTSASGWTLEPDLTSYKFDRPGRLVRYQHHPTKFPIAGNAYANLPPGGVIGDLHGDKRGLDVAFGCPARIAIDPSRPSFLVRLWYEAVDSVLTKELKTRLPAPEWTLASSITQSVERPSTVLKLRNATPGLAL